MLDRPGDSPELDDIENRWRIIKNVVCAEDPSSLQKLQEEIRNVWCLGMTPAYFKKLSDSMPNLIRMVTKNNVYMKEHLGLTICVSW